MTGAMQGLGEIPKDEDTLIPFVFGVTGHRDLRASDIPALEDSTRRIFEQFQERYPNTPLVVLSPLAEGADRLVAKIGLECGSRLVVPLPMPQAEYEMDFVLCESKDEFHELLASAKKVIVLPFFGDNTSSNTREHGDRRNIQYEQSGAFIASNCQVLIALWDGIIRPDVGGTSEIVRFRLEGIPERYLAGDYLDRPRTGSVFQIVTPRESDKETNGRPFKLHAKYPGDDVDNWDKPPGSFRGAWPGNKFKEAFEKSLLNTDGYNRDVKRILSSTVQTKRNEAIERSSAYCCNGVLEQLVPILTRHATADALAVEYQKKLSRFLISISILAMVSIAALWLSLGVFQHLYILAIYPALMSAAGILYVVARRQNQADKYVDYRALAEGLRVQTYWKLFGIEDSVQDHYLKKHQGELVWITDAYSSWELLEMPSQPSRMTLQEKCCAIKNLWIEDQHQYFNKKFGVHSSKLTRGRMAEQVLFWFSSVLIIAMLFILWLATSGTERTVVIGILGTLVALAFSGSAAIENYINKMAYAELEKQYFRMCQLYGRASRKLDQVDFAGDPERAQDIARELLVKLGMEALEESGDWLLLQRSRPIQVPHD